ncbi:MAG: haloacid dehalogenase superfamily protein subfamily variant 3 with third motif having or [Bacteroidetes bacterium]|jgi:sugar-phosphatase|nr:haloacid dehalogenase superfamily protein subfamily variant 3 with third motif having or [Bacteroidota bacterium]
MFNPARALIFDMDGVLIDSEPLWRKAMIIGFTNAGMPFTDEDCRKTTGMRFREVVEIWLKHFNVNTTTPAKLEDEVLDILIHLIETEGKAIPGALEVFEYAKRSGLKVGLATSSSHRLMNAVLKKLGIENGFDVAVSAEFMDYGKPHPEVFLVCASKLGVDPKECLVIEDSLNGIIAAKAAQMKVFAIPDQDHRHLKGFGAADYFYETMFEVLGKLKTIV